MTSGQMWIARQLVERPQSGVRPLHHRQCNDLTETSHRAPGHLKKHAVERVQLRPVGGVGARRFVVKRGDCSLNLKWTWRMRRERGLEQLGTFADSFAIPERTILFVERDEFSE